jgi:hypothetical protein
MSRLSRGSRNQEEFLCLKNIHESLHYGLPGSNSETRGRFCDGLGRIVMVQYSFRSIITVYDRTNAREYVDGLGNQMHPMIQRLFQEKKNDAVFRDDRTPTHRAETVELCCEEHEGELPTSSLASTVTSFEQH